MEEIGRLAIVLVLSLGFGFLRQKMHKPIGFGTFTFVSVGAAALALVALLFAPESPLPLLGATVTGIGFLGAGALIRTADKITGFTSAATIWLFAIFGLVVGLGEYQLGMIVYSISILILAIDYFLESRSIGAYQKRVIITANKIIPSKEFDDVFSGFRHKVVSVEINKTTPTMTTTYLVEGTKQEINSISKELLNKPWFESCKVD